MELMIVTLTLAVIISLALSNYSKVTEQAYCRNAQINLRAIQSAAIINGVKFGLTNDISSANTATINTTLRLNISDEKFNYVLWGTPANAFSRATRIGGPNYNCEFNGPRGKVTCSNIVDFCPDVSETPT